MKAIVLSLIALLASTTFTPAHANPPTDDNRPWYIDYIVGPSVPMTDAALKVDANDRNMTTTAGISRVSGGERIAIRFRDAKKNYISEKITGIRLISYSKSRAGKVLIRNVESAPTQHAGFFNPLSKAEGVSQGSGVQDYQGNVLLGNEDFVELNFPSELSLSDITVTAEGFDSDDASLVVQLISRQRFTDGFYITRNMVNPPLVDSGSSWTAPENCISSGPNSVACYGGSGTYNCITGGGVTTCF